MNIIVMMPVAGFPGYSVTPCGRVLAPQRSVWLKPRPHRQGYVRATLYRVGKPKGCSQMVHRLVGLAYLPNPHRKPEINHKDGDKKNNDWRNLEWSTRRENQEHATKIGLWQPHLGEAHGRAKLTLEQARHIKAMRGVATSRTLATECGVSIDTVRSVWNGLVWRHA